MISEANHRWTVSLRLETARPQAEWWEFDAGDDQVGFVMTDGEGRFVATVEKSTRNRSLAFELRMAVKEMFKQRLREAKA